MANNILNSIDWTQLIQISSNGIIVADYSSVRSAIIERFKQIYGDDIDLASTSADGVYVETLSLMISNILQSFKTFISNLDVRTAGGTYLDALCALSNVYRKQASNSTASVTLTLDENSDAYTTNELTLVDKSGNTWTYKSSTAITFEPNIPTDVIVTCDSIGPIRAPANWINQLVQSDVVMTISQPNAAAVGQYEESDSELRARRNNSLGATGYTVLETMIGSLYQLNGIIDVKIYNNNTTISITALDGTSITRNSIYVLIRRRKNISISDNNIGSIIYERLTPGISTIIPNPTDSTNGIIKQITYSQDYQDIPALSTILQKVYWKECVPAKVKYTIIIIPQANYATSTANNIVQAFIDFMNNLQISGSYHYSELWTSLSTVDPKFRGAPTYYIKSITSNTSKFITVKDDITTLNDCYFEFDALNAKISTSIDGNIQIDIEE